jgi:hypothetical protein
MSNVLIRLPAPGAGLAWAALAIALSWAAPACADDFSALFDTNFTYTRVPSSPKQLLPALDTDQYTFKLAGLYTFDNPGFAVQLEGQDDFHYGTKFNLAHLWNAGGDFFFRDNKGTVGVSVSYFGVDAPALPLFPTKTSLESYGAFGEYYVFDTLTLQGKAGGTTGSGVAGGDSVYASGGFVWYETPDVAFHMTAGYTAYKSANNWVDVDASFEYLPFYSLPVSLYMGYDFVNISGLGYTKASTFFGGFKVHFGEGRTLRDYQRTGPVEWTGYSTPGANLKY